MFKSQLNIAIFKIIQLINMNISLRKYHVEVWVTALSGIHPGYSYKEGRRRTPTRILL
jgi:hypothetical protein